MAFVRVIHAPPQDLFVWVLVLGLYGHHSFLLDPETPNALRDVLGVHLHSAGLPQGPFSAPRLLSGVVHFATLHLCSP